MERIIRIFKYKHLFFFCLIAGQMLVYNYVYMLKIEPRYHHAWRQFDCLSFAQSYFEDRGGDLLHPKVNNLGVSKNGNAASEFPIIPYLVSNLWKVTGPHSLVYRLVNILLLFIGLFYIYKLFLYLSSNKVLAALLAAFIFTSGNLSYYGMSTLSDIQAFSFSVIAFYYFVIWIGNGRMKSLTLFSAFICLAGLIKASFILIFVLCVLWSVMKYLIAKDLVVEQKTKLNAVLLLLSPVLIWFAWIWHARAYNLENTKVFFLVGTLPIWTLSPQQIQEHLSNLTTGLLPEFMSIPFLIIFTGLAIYYLVVNKGSSLVNKWMVLFVLLFSFVYLLLFFGAFDVHDYYLIVFNGMLVLFLFFLCTYINKSFIEIHLRRIVVFLLICVAFGTYVSSIKTWKKVNYNVVNFENDLVFTKKQQTNLFWNYWHDRRKYEVLENEFTTKEAGISPNDTVFCLGDPTINRSLYLMNVVGYTEFNCDLQHVQEFLLSHQEVRYVILIDDDYKDSISVQLMSDKKVFERKNLSVYKVK